VRQRAGRPQLKRDPLGCYDHQNVNSLLFLEVMDKELSLLAVWGIFAGLGFLSLVLARLKRWLGVVSLPLMAFFASAQVGELLDPFVGPAILEEAGRAYVVQSYIAITVGLLLSLVSPFVRVRRSSLTSA
jgi:hypothetical protein